jgi:hypothetical protein
MGELATWLLQKSGIPKRLRSAPAAAMWRGWLAGLERRWSEAERAAEAGMLLECPDANLDAHLRNTGDWRAPGESHAQVRAYLADRWPAYKEAGTPEALVRQLARHRITNFEIVRELDLRHASIPGAFGGEEGYYFLVFYPPHPLSDEGSTLWDGGGSWDDGAVWNGTQTDYIEALRAIIRRWEAGGESCRFIVAGENGSFTYDPMTFTWGGDFTRYPVGKAWEWVGGLHPYYHFSYTTP